MALFITQCVRNSDRACHLAGDNDVDVGTEAANMTNMMERKSLTQVIKALKTLVWHLSKEPMKEISSLKK